MKKSFAIVGMVCLSTLGAVAQDMPRMEAFVGYTYVRFNKITGAPPVSANGGGGQLVYNLNTWLGLVGDVGVVHNGDIGVAHLDSRFTNFLFGPRLAFRHAHLTPYFQVLFGGVHASSSGLVNVVPVTIESNQTAFAMTAGGGLDIKLGRHVSFRPIGLDYYLTRLQNLRRLGDDSQNNLRYTTGFNFTFGAQ